MPATPCHYQSTRHMTANPRMARKAQPAGFSLFLFRCALVYAAVAAALVAMLAGPDADDDLDGANGSHESLLFLPVPGGWMAASRSIALLATRSRFLAAAVAAAYVVATLLLLSFAVAVRCRLRTALQAFLWKERYNTQFKVSPPDEPAAAAAAAAAAPCPVSPSFVGTQGLSRSLRAWLAGGR